MGVSEDQNPRDISGRPLVADFSVDGYGQSPAVADKPRIRLATIHGSKGGEADHVVLLPDMARRTHEEMLVQPEDEARVWYVAATRARRQLTLVKPRDKLHYVI